MVYKLTDGIVYGLGLLQKEGLNLDLFERFAHLIFLNLGGPFLLTNPRAMLNLGSAYTLGVY